MEYPEKIQMVLAEAVEDTESCAAYMHEHMMHSIEVFKKKNLPYGNSAIRGVERYGAQSGVWRLYDKFNRVESLLYGTENTVSDESLEDSLIDLANYCHIISYAIKKLNQKEVNSND